MTHGVRIAARHVSSKPATMEWFAGAPFRIRKRRGVVTEERRIFRGFTRARDDYFDELTVERARVSARRLSSQRLLLPARGGCRAVVY